MVIVSLAAAVICFANECYPVLVGKNTPVGTYQMIHAKTPDKGYGGDVLVFARDSKGVFAIHRVWTLSPSQKRVERLKSEKISDRLNITGGCINVDPVVYEKLLDCCSKEELRIQEK